MTILGPNPRASISSGRAFRQPVDDPSIGYPSDVGPCLPRVNSSEPPKVQDDQIIALIIFYYLDETKDLAANMTKPIHGRQNQAEHAIRNRANRGNREEAYSAYGAFSAQFF
jgi:hypothetical protein